MSLSNNFKERFRAALASFKASTEFLNIHDVATAGTVEASKVVQVDASKNVTGINNLTMTGALTVGGNAVRAGGLAYVNVADSTPVTSTSTETVFDANYAIPANTLVAGSVVVIRWSLIVTASNSTDTGQFKTYLATNTTAGSVAGTAFVTTAATDMTNNDIVEGETVIVVRTAGSSGTCVATSGFTKTEAASNTATRVSVMTNSTTINTQTAQTACVSATFSTNNAGNSATLRVMSVSIT